jgi:hypothetical protein
MRAVLIARITEVKDSGLARRQLGTGIKPVGPLQS